MSNIDFTRMISAEDKASRALAEARDAARVHLLAALSAAAQRLTGPVPQAERDSWPVKEAAARALAQGTATPAQAAMLAVEARITGEDVADLAARIIASADAYSIAAATIAGIRRHLTARIDAAETLDEINAATDDLRAALADF